jgi:hypothetical protein
MLQRRDTKDSSNVPLGTLLSTATLIGLQAASARSGLTDSARLNDQPRIRRIRFCAALVHGRNTATGDQQKKPHEGMLVPLPVITRVIKELRKLNCLRQ